VLTLPVGVSVSELCSLQKISTIMCLKKAKVLILMDINKNQMSFHDLQYEVFVAGEGRADLFSRQVRVLRPGGCGAGASSRWQ
jgi:hypothetical protein